MGNATQQPGATPPAPGSISVVRATGPKPGGTMPGLQTTVVTVLAIDLTIPSITIKTEAGRTTSFQVEDKNTSAPSQGATRCR